MLQKLFLYGIRQQRVCILQHFNEYFSNISNIKEGVPQGSVLYIFLFISVSKVWNNTVGGRIYLEGIFIMQKSILKTMPNMKYTESYGNILKNNQSSTLYAIYIYVCVIFVFDNMSKFEYIPKYRLKNTEKGSHYAPIKFYSH